MSYEYNREEEYGERQEHHHNSHQQAHRNHGHRQEVQGELHNEGYPAGGYGKDAERPMHGYNSSHDEGETGGYNPGARHNLDSQGSESQRRNEYEHLGSQHAEGGHDHHHVSEGHGHGHVGTGGRSAIGSGESYVGLGHKERHSGGAYREESTTTYSSIQDEHRGTEFSEGSTESSGVYVVGSGEKWKPGQEMHFPAAEAETKNNPLAPFAQQMAGDTQGILKEGIKELENWAESKVKEAFGGHR